jgi:hypothetical protein
MWEHRSLGIVLPHRLERKTLDGGDTPGLGRSQGAARGKRP